MNGSIKKITLLVLCAALISFCLSVPARAAMTNESTGQTTQTVSSDSSPQSAAEETSEAASGPVSKNIADYSNIARKWAWLPILGILVSVFLLVFINVRAGRAGKESKKGFVVGRVQEKRKIIVKKRKNVA